MLANIISSIFVIAFFFGIPFAWIGFFVTRVRCRNVTSCVKKRCPYWEVCLHSGEAREKEKLRLRILKMGRSAKIPEEKVRELLDRLDRPD